MNNMVYATHISKNKIKKLKRNPFFLYVDNNVDNIVIIM